MKFCKSDPDRAVPTSSFKGILNTKPSHRRSFWRCALLDTYRRWNTHHVWWEGKNGEAMCAHFLVYEHAVEKSFPLSDTGNSRPYVLFLYLIITNSISSEYLRNIGWYLNSFHHWLLYYWTCNWSLSRETVSHALNSKFEVSRRSGSAFREKIAK